MSQFESAILTVCNTYVLPNRDKLFPAFGFGAELPGQKEVCVCVCVHSILYVHGYVMLFYSISFIMQYIPIQYTVSIYSVHVTC